MEGRHPTDRVFHYLHRRGGRPVPKKVAEGGISLERFGIGSRIQIGLEQYPERFWVYVGVSLICLLLTYYLIHLYRNRERFTRVAAG